MTDAEFHHFLDTVGHMIRPEEFRMAVYQGGVEPSLRSVVWRHLLNIFPEGMSGKERFEYTKRKNNEYYKLRDQWRELFTSNREIEELKFITNMVKKDVLRTDRTHVHFEGSDDNQNVISLFNILVTYAITHPDVSYCQGMSDLVSPILVVQKDEAAAYLCFCGLMKRLRVNFLLDGVAMTTKFQHLALLLQHQDPDFYGYLRSQDAHDMFFCYRWLLLELKREFPFDNALLMLEVMWSSQPPDPPETELLLADPSFSFSRLVYSPVSPSVANNAYMRLKSLCRQTSQTKAVSRVNGDSDPSHHKLKSSPAGSIDTSMAITPLEEEKDQDLKEFVPTEDKLPQDLIIKSSQIDKALNSAADISVQKDNCESTCQITECSKQSKLVQDSNDCNVSSEKVPSLGAKVKTSHSNEISDTNESDNHVAFQKDNGDRTDKTIWQDKNESECRNGSTSCLDDSNNGECKLSRAEGSLGGKEAMGEQQCGGEPQSPGKRRPQSIVLQQTYEPVAKNGVAAIPPTSSQASGGGQSVLIRNEADDVTERSSKLGVPREAEINSCEEAMENPGIDFVHVSEKLQKLPPPAEFGYGNPFLMFLCLTLLTQQRDHIMRNRMDYNDLAMHFDKMVRRHNVFKVLRQAQSQYAFYLRNQASMASSSSGSSEDVSV